MPSRKRMTDEEILEIALSCKSRRELRDGFPAVLTAIYRRKLADQAFAHMQRERFYPAYEKDATSRICTTCGIEKDFDQFHKASKGFIRATCKSCCNDQSNAWRAANPERSREIKKKSYAKYPEKVAPRQKIKREQSPHIYAARDLLKRVLNLTGQRKSRSTEQLLGYTANDLREHLEKRFVDGMSWENRSDWHIDHILPVAVMVSRGITDPAVINALSNLRPLWAHDNLTRAKKVSHYGG